MERISLVHPTIVFGGDTDVLELIKRLSSYNEKSKRDVFINGVLSCSGNVKTKEILIPGNLKIHGICNNRISLSILGNLDCSGEIDVGILKVAGNVYCQKSINAYDFTVKGRVCCEELSDGQFVIIGKDLSVTKEIYPAINVKSLRVGGNIYCQGSMEGDSLFASGDVSCKKYMAFSRTEIKGKTFIEEA